MLVIRLRRIGRKNDPHYRLVVAEHTAPVQGKFIAEVGHYHPKTKEIQINQDQFLGWLERGAKPSNTVAKLAERSGIAHEQIVVTEYKGQPKKKARLAREQRETPPVESSETAPSSEAESPSDTTNEPVKTEAPSE